MTQESNLAALPTLSESYELTADEVRYYQDNGHIVLRGVASQDEVLAYEPFITDTVRTHSRQNRPLAERDTYGKAFIQIGNLCQKSEAVRRFVLAKRFAKIAANLMGVERVRLYHDQALYKEPGGGYTPWHQDQIYWPMDTEHTITMWMPLVPISQEVGSMTFASQFHRQGFITKAVISDESHRTLEEYLRGKGATLVNHGAMAAGDATFHSGWTPHCAPSNPTETMRKVMTIIYYADGTRLVEPDSNARRGDMKAIYPGLQGGDLAASPLTPVVYPELEEVE